MTLPELDWGALERLRDRFLQGRKCETPYWETQGDLASYDATFGERIGWKWDAVLDELAMRGWTPPDGPVLDWGCGSGVAGRRVLGRFGAGTGGSLGVWDHSPLATSFALEKAQRDFPTVAVSVAGHELLGGNGPIGLLILSHVLNELTPSALESVRTLAARAKALIWVEPGNRETSRLLGQLRDGWLDSFTVVAPCTRQGACPMFESGNERHWCHHFASPPAAIFGDADWVKFGRRAGVDLRSLPYSFIALDRTPRAEKPGLSRIIGRPEAFKPYVRLLNCDVTGLAELTLMKRGNEALFKNLERTKRPLVYRWTREGSKIASGAAAHPGT